MPVHQLNPKELTLSEHLNDPMVWEALLERMPVTAMIRNLATMTRAGLIVPGSDAASLAAEGAFLREATHPRAYGTFARWLGTYVRDEGIVPLAQGIRRQARG